MNILVTGGAGYIGAHSVKELLSQGHKVSVVDRMSTGKDKNVDPDAILHKGDFGDLELLNRIFDQDKIEAVVHLAGSIDAFESFEKPLEYFENNTLKTAKLAQAMVEKNITKLVFASSAAVYGAQIQTPIHETAELKPINPYGESKLLAEQELQYFATYAGLKVAALRFFNVCGSKEGSGIYSQNTSSLLAQIINAIKTNTEFKINGDDFDTEDGTCIRDLVHVQDIVQGCVLAVNQLEAQEKNFEAYNLGTGAGFSIKEVVSAFERVLEKSVQSQVLPRKLGDIPVSVSSIEKAATLLRYKPTSSDLETIVKTSWH